MTTVNDWSSAVTGAFQGLWVKFINYLPAIIGAIIVLIVGLILANLLSQLAKKLIQALRIDSLLESWGVSKQLDAMGIGFNFADIIAWIVKWFIIIAVWIAVVNVLHLDRVGDMLQRLLFYIPNIVTAVIILAIGLVGGSWISQVVERAVTASQLPNASAGLLGAIARWALVIFALLAALTQLGVATNLIEILFTGLVAMVALAGGLAFGLGGKDHANKLLERIQGEAAPKSVRR